METVYKKIKELRVKSGMTLKELGGKTGLTPSFLSQVERGNSSLAINTLQKIADAFEVQMTFFFDNTSEEHFIVTPETQERMKGENFETVYIRLNGKFPQRSLAPFILKMSPHQKKTKTFQYPGEEFYYVLEGEVIFTIDNKEYHVKKDESIHFPAHLEHYGENSTDQETVMIGVVTPVIF